MKDTADRVIPYLNEKILPEVYSGKNIIVSAHGNSIRAIVMALKKFTPEEILKTEIGWCEPWIFEFEKEKFCFWQMFKKWSQIATKVSEV